MILPVIERYKRMKFFSSVVLGIGLLLSLNAQARPVTPFFTFNQSPLVQLYGLPAIEEARILNPGEQRYRLQADLASNYSIGQSGAESIVLDGEITRLTLAFSGHGGRNFEWGLQVPYVSHSGGMLDGFIRRWHDTFGMSQGGRTAVPDDVLNYRYVRDGQTLVSQTLESDGVGDVRLTGGWQLLRPGADDNTAFTLRASLKLPTGDSEQLRGSGGTDLALWLNGGYGGYGLGPSASVFGGLGVLLMNRGDVLPELQRSSVLFGSLGAGAWVLPRLSLKVQLDFNGAIYRDSELTQLGNDSLQLSVGGSLRLVKHTRIELAVVEDVAVATAPDVVFHATIVVQQ